MAWTCSISVVSGAQPAQDQSAVFDVLRAAVITTTAKIVVLALIDRLSPGDGLCHCDLSPGNVIMTAEGPKLVDWAFAMRAPAALDLGFLHVILSELAPEIADNPERPRATNAAAQSEYARLAGMSLADRRGDVRTGGRDRRGAGHVSSQDDSAAGDPFHA